MIFKIFETAAILITLLALGLFIACGGASATRGAPAPSPKTPHNLQPREFVGEWVKHWDSSRYDVAFYANGRYEARFSACRWTGTWRAWKGDGGRWNLTIRESTNGVSWSEYELILDGRLGGRVVFTNNCPAAGPNVRLTARE